MILIDFDHFSKPPKDILKIYWKESPFEKKLDLHLTLFEDGDIEWS